MDVVASCGYVLTLANSLPDLALSGDSVRHKYTVLGVVWACCGAVEYAVAIAMSLALCHVHEIRCLWSALALYEVAEWVTVFFYA